MKKPAVWISIVMLLLAGQTFAADPAQLTVHVDQPGVKISPMLYGLMTEEINHSYDGGLYGEMIQNRIFKDAAGPAHWSLVTGNGAQGDMVLDSVSEPVNKVALTTSLRLDITDPGNGRVGAANDGFWGIPIKPNTVYHASFYARASDGFSGPLMISIESSDGSQALASAVINGVNDKWKQYTATLKTGDVAASTDNRFVISAVAKGSIWLNLVSLFPPTYKDRANGNRIDLMEKLADMHPAFLRLPGGNYLEGNTIDERFEWKDTIGPLEGRRAGHQGPWGYRSSDGMGLLEFLEWCEDLRMEPILAVYGGYSLRGQRISAGPELQAYVQDALDEIEYVTGDRTSKWGQVPARDGHPNPFKLTYVEVGNEDNFDGGPGSYEGRFAQFFDAIKAKYPKLQVIATAHVATRAPDVVDDHYYRSAREMERDVHHYDTTDRNGPKIFVGEWATTEGNPTPTMNAALGDAAWMTGMERNSDVVVIASYAPLLVNVNPQAAQWGTNLIGYDAMKSYGSPSYYAQKMFSENRGDRVVLVDLTSPAPAAVDQPAPHGGIGLGTWATTSEYKDLKVTRNSDNAVLYQSDFSKGLDGFKSLTGQWKADAGTLQQTSSDTDCRATFGDVGWGDYTYSLKARKISGNEGFLILFHVVDADNYLWFNVGGWTNTRTALEKVENGAKAPLGDSVDMAIEPNRWYDLRVEVAGRSIKCYVDDKMVIQATDEPAAPAPTMFATASRIDSSGQIIIKLVNHQPTAQSVAIDLQGIKGVAGNATAVVLSGSPGDVNTIAEPEKVIPHTVTIPNAAAKFTYEAAPDSVTILKLQPQ